MASSVLVVDGDAVSRDHLARLLRDGTFGVLTAATAPEGMAILSSLHPQIVLFDLDMPGTDGFALLHQIRVESTEAVVIAMSARQDPWLVVRAMRAGAVDFVGKSASPGAIVSAVKGAL